jgi:hypothetical protein
MVERVMVEEARCDVCGEEKPFVAGMRLAGLGLVFICSACARRAYGAIHREKKLAEMRVEA